MGTPIYASKNPAKRAVERYWLLYTPVWGLVSAVVMVGGLAERWGDVELMAYGLLLASGALAGPLLRPAPEDAAKPWLRRSGVKLAFSVVFFSLAMNYYCAPFFFDVLHMHYGFDTTWNVRGNNPLFLFFVTIAYFATYLVMVNVAYRVARAKLEAAPRPLKWLGLCAVPFAVAFLESLLNANPFIESLFCYDDLFLTLTFGTFCYGTAFVFTLPVWVGIDEASAKEVSFWRALLWNAAAMFGIIVAFDLYRFALAPHVTDVIEGAHGFRDFATSCLVPSLQR